MDELDRHLCGLFDVERIRLAVLLSSGHRGLCTIDLKALDDVVKLRICGKGDSRMLLDLRLRVYYGAGSRCGFEGTMLANDTIGE